MKLEKSALPRRNKREKDTALKMIRIYCRNHHQTNADLCVDCRDLTDYALLRIDRCPFAPDKPACNKCPVHCYQPQMRERIRTVMRYSGPRMLLYHPRLAILHLFDSLTKNVHPKQNQK